MVMATKILILVQQPIMNFWLPIIASQAAKKDLAQQKAWISASCAGCGGGKLGHLQ